MARGRGYGGPVIITSSGADDVYLGSASSRAGRLASYTINDQDDVRRQSRRQDKALLDSITNKLATASFRDPAPLRSSGRLRVVPYSSGGARSYVTYYVGDRSSAANISPRFQSVTPSMSVLEPRYRPKTYSFYGGAYGLGRRGRSGLDYLDLQSSYRPYPARSRRFDYLDLSLPLDIHNYLESSRYSPSVSYVPRYYRTSFDDSDIYYRPRHYPYLTDLYSTPYSSSRYTPSLSYYTPSLYDYDYESYLPSPRSRALYPYNYDLQLYPELGSSAPRRRASVSYTTSSRLPLAPSRPSVSYYDDIEWPDYRPSAIRFQPLRDGSCPPALGAAPSTNLAVRNARRSLFRIERELGDFANNYGSYSGGYSGYDDYDVDYVPSRRTTVVRTGGSLPPSSSTVRRTITTTAPKSRIREIEARLDLMSDASDPPLAQMSLLRSRASDARNKMDRTKVLLDRYLPAPTGPIPAVEYEIESKYDELAQRMPYLSRVSGSSAADSGSSSSYAVKPYTPAQRPRSNSFSGPSYSRSSPDPSCTPPVSDVRKRCRQVLCKTKGDPTYYRL